VSTLTGYEVFNRVRDRLAQRGISGPEADKILSRVQDRMMAKGMMPTSTGGQSDVPRDYGEAYSGVGEGVGEGVTQTPPVPGDGGGGLPIVRTLAGQYGSKAADVLSGVVPGLSVPAASGMVGKAASIADAGATRLAAAYPQMLGQLARLTQGVEAAYRNPGQTLLRTGASATKAILDPGGTFAGVPGAATPANLMVPDAGRFASEGLDAMADQVPTAPAGPVASAWQRGLGGVADRSGQLSKTIAGLAPSATDDFMSPEYIAGNVAGSAPQTLGMMVVGMLAGPEAALPAMFGMSATAETASIIDDTFNELKKNDPGMSDDEALTRSIGPALLMGIPAGALDAGSGAEAAAVRGMVERQAESVAKSVARKLLGAGKELGRTALEEAVQEPTQGIMEDIGTAMSQPSMAPITPQDVAEQARKRLTESVVSMASSVAGGGIGISGHFEGVGESSKPTPPRPKAVPREDAEPVTPPPSRGGTDLHPEVAKAIADLEARLTGKVNEAGAPATSAAEPAATSAPSTPDDAAMARVLADLGIDPAAFEARVQEERDRGLIDADPRKLSPEDRERQKRAVAAEVNRRAKAFQSSPQYQAEEARKAEMLRLAQERPNDRGGDPNEGGAVAGGVRSPGPDRMPGRDGVDVPQDVRPVENRVAPMVGHDGAQAGDQPGDVGGGRPDAEVEPWQMTRDEWEANRGDSKNTWGFGEDGTGAVWVSEQMPAPGGWIPETRYTLTPEEAAEYKRREAVKGKAGYAAKVEFRNRMLAKAKGKLTGDHRALVEIALSEGRQVAPEVLADYPELSENAKPQQPVAASSRQDYDDPSRLRNIGTGRIYAGRRVLASMSARGEPTTDPRMIDSASDYRRRGMEVLIRRDGEGFGYVIGVEPQQPGAVSAAPSTQGATNGQGQEKGRQERLLTNEPAAPETSPTGVLSPPPAGAALAAPSVSPDLDSMTHDELKAYAKSIGVPPLGSPDGIRARIRKAQADQLSAKDNPAKTDSSIPKVLPWSVSSVNDEVYVKNNRDGARVSRFGWAKVFKSGGEWTAQLFDDNGRPGEVLAKSKIKGRASAAAKEWMQRSIDRETGGQAPASSATASATQATEASPRVSAKTQSPSAAPSASTATTPAPSANQNQTTPQLSSGVKPSSWDATPNVASATPNVASATPDVASGFLSALTPEERSELESLERQLYAKVRFEARSGIDPEIVSLGMRIGSLYFKAGSRKFADFARNLVARVGQEVKPYLKSIYMATVAAPGVDSKGADSLDAVARMSEAEVEAATGAQAAAAHAGRLQITPTRKNISPEARSVESALTSMVQDQASADAAYNALPETHGGKIIGLDHARSIHPMYRDSIPDRWWLTDATSMAARAYARDRIMRDVQNPPTPKNGDRPILLLTAGSQGSGKSTSLAADRAIADKVWDSNLTNAEDASKVIDEAIKNGWLVHIRYVYRPFNESLASIANRATAREEGRPVVFSEAVTSRLNGAKAIGELAQRYGNDPNVSLSAIRNVTNGNPVSVGISDVAAGGKLAYTESELRTIADEQLEAARKSGQVPPHILGALAGRSATPGEIESERHGRAGQRGQEAARAGGAGTQAAGEVGGSDSPYGKQGGIAPPAYRDWRTIRRAANSVRVVPNVPGAKFTAEQISTIASWADGNGWTVVQKSPNGMVVLSAAGGKRLEIDKYGAPGVKSEKAAEARKGQEAAEDQKRAEQNARADNRDSADWINETFGEGFANGFNRNALSDFLEGETPTLKALPTSKWEPGLRKVGAVTDDGRVDMKALKAAYESRERPATVSIDPAIRARTIDAIVEAATAGEVGGSARTLDEIAAEFRTRIRQDYTPENLAAISALRKEAFERFGVQALENLPTAKAPPRDVATIEREISAIQKRLDNLHANYKGPGRGGTRAQTTTYNANVGRLSESMGHLKDELRRAQEAKSTGRPSAPTPPRVKKFRDMAARLMAQAEALEKNSSRRFDSAPGAAVTGGSGRHRSGLHEKTNRAIEGSLDDLRKAKRLREAASKWSARADNLDPEVIRQREHRKAVVLEAREKVKAKESAERKAAPIINEDGEGVLRITADEWKKADKDYKGISVRDGVRVRTLLRGGSLHEVFITDMPVKTRADSASEIGQGGVYRDEGDPSKMGLKDADGLRILIKDTKNGWRYQETPDGAVLVHPADNKAVRFRVTDERSGSQLLRARTEAQAYAQDNPVQAAATSAGDLVVKPIGGEEPKQPSAPLQRAREARANKVLDEQMMARSRGKVMTRRELVDAEIAEGATPLVQDVEDTAAVNRAVEQKKIMDRRIVPTGNPNHPETIRYRELEATIKNPPKKPEYRMVKDGAWRVLTKSEYDYAVTKKRDAGEQAAKKDNDPYAADIEKLTAILRKQVATESSPRRQGQAAIVVLNGEAPAVQEAVAKVLWEIAPGAAEYVASDGPIGVRGVVAKAKPEVAASPTSSEQPVSIVGDAERIDLDDGTSFLRHTLSDGTRLDEHDGGVEHWRPVGPGRQSLGQYATVDEALRAANARTVTPPKATDTSQATAPSNTPAVTNIGKYRVFERPGEGWAVNFDQDGAIQGRRGLKTREEAEALARQWEARDQEIAADRRKNHPMTLAEYPKVRDRIMSGDQTADEHKELARWLMRSEPAIKAELGQKTIKQLAPNGTGGNTKASIIDTIYRNMLGRFHLGDSVSYNPFGGETYESALTKKIEATTDEDIRAFKEKRQKAVDSRKKALENPETLDEFRQFIEKNGEAALSVEQRKKYDELTAAVNKRMRGDDRPDYIAKVDTGGVQLTVKEGFHEKQGIPLWIVQMSGRVDSDAYKALVEAAKKLGGWWSSFKKESTGFQFKTKAAADEFVQINQKSITTETTDKAREETQAEKAAARLIEMADAKIEAADEELGRDRNTNTIRRARMADSAEAGARKAKQMAETLANIAEGIQNGTAKALRGIRNMAQLEELERSLMLAQREYWYSLPEESRRAIDPSGNWWNLPMDENIIAKAVMPMPEPHKDHVRAIASTGMTTPGIKREAAKLDKLWRYSEKRNPDSPVVKIDSPYDFNAAKAVASRLKGAGAAKYAAESVYDALMHHQRVADMGIKSSAEMRVALREYMGFRVGQAQPDAVREMERGLIGKTVGIDFFPTPPALASEVVDKADIEPGMKVLEPSAGNGRIADAIKAAGVTPDVAEVSGNLRAILEKKGYPLEGRDFMEFNPGPVYDRIVMNPPFSNRMDVEHVRHAYDLLKPGGRIVAIMSEGPFFGRDKKASEFRDWLDTVGTSEQLPEGSFQSDKSGLPTTGVNARVVVIDKPQAGEKAQAPQATPAAKSTPSDPLHDKVMDFRQRLNDATKRSDLTGMEDEARMLADAADRANRSDLITMARGFVGQVQEKSGRLAAQEYRAKQDLMGEKPVDKSAPTPEADRERLVTAMQEQMRLEKAARSEFYKTRYNDIDDATRRGHEDKEASLRDEADGMVPEIASIVTRSVGEYPSRLPDVKPTQPAAGTPEAKKVLSDAREAERGMEELWAQERELDREIGSKASGSKIRATLERKRESLRETVRTASAEWTKRRDAMIRMKQEHAYAGADPWRRLAVMATWNGGEYTSVANYLVKVADHIAGQIAPVLDEEARGMVARAAVSRFMETPLSESLTSRLDSELYVHTKKANQAAAIKRVNEASPLQTSERTRYIREIEQTDKPEEMDKIAKEAELLATERDAQASAAAEIQREADEKEKAANTAALTDPSKMRATTARQAMGKRALPAGSPVNGTNKLAVWTENIPAKLRSQIESLGEEPITVRGNALTSEAMARMAGSLADKSAELATIVGAVGRDGEPFVMFAYGKDGVGAVNGKLWAYANTLGQGEWFTDGSGDHLVLKSDGKPIVMVAGIRKEAVPPVNLEGSKARASRGWKDASEPSPKTYLTPKSTAPTETIDQSAYPSLEDLGIKTEYSALVAKAEQATRDYHAALEAVSDARNRANTSLTDEVILAKARAMSGDDEPSSGFRSIAVDALIRENPDLKAATAAVEVAQKAKILAERAVEAERYRAASAFNGEAEDKYRGLIADRKWWQHDAEANAIERLWSSDPRVAVLRELANTAANSYEIDTAGEILPPDFKPGVGVGNYTEPKTDLTTDRPSALGIDTKAMEDRVKARGVADWTLQMTPSPGDHADKGAAWLAGDRVKALEGIARIAKAAPEFRADPVLTAANGATRLVWESGNERFAFVNPWHKSVEEPGPIADGQTLRIDPDTIGDVKKRMWVSPVKDKVEVAGTSSSKKALTLLEKLDKAAADAVSRIKKRGIQNRGRTSGATTLIDDTLDAAVVVAAKAVAGGIRGGQKLTRLVSDVLASLKAAGGKSAVLDDVEGVRKVARKLLRDAGGMDAALADPTAILRAYAANREALDRRRTRNVGKAVGDTAGVKAAVAGEARERPGVTKPGDAREARLLNQVQQGENREASARAAGEQAGFRAGQAVGEQTGGAKVRSSAAREIVRSRREAYKAGVAEAKAGIPAMVRQLRQEQTRQRQTAEIERRGAVDATKAVSDQEAAIREGIRKLAQKLPMPVRGKFLRAVEASSKPLHLARAVRDMSKALSRYEAARAARAASKWGSPAYLKRLTNAEREIVRGHMRTVKATWQTVKEAGTNADQMYAAARALEDAYRAIRTVYAQHYAETHAIKALRGETAKEAAAQAVENIERAKKPMAESERVEDVDANAVTKLGRGFMDLRNATESVEGKHDGTGVLYNLMHRVMTMAEDAYFTEKRKRYAQIEKAVKAAGFDGLADAFEKLTGAGGKALQSTIRVPLGGQARTISLGQAASLAAIDPSSEDLISRGMKVQMREGRFLTPMAVTMDEIDRLRLRLKMEHPGLLRMVAAFKGIMEEMRPDVFRVHRILKGFEPEIVHDRWPRVRNLSAGENTQSLPESSHEMVNRVLENSGFLKERTGGTDAPMMVDDVLNVVFDQVDQAAKVTHIALPVRDAANVLLDTRVRTAIASRWGGKFYTDLKRMLMASSRANQVLNTPGARIVHMLNSNIAVTALASNVGTYMRQAAGLTRLTPYLSAADWAHGVASVPKVSMKEMTDASGYLWDRYIGSPAGRMSPVMSEGAEAMDRPGIGRAMRQTIANVKAGDIWSAYKAWQRGGKAIMEGVNLADSIVARAAWAGFMRQAEREHPEWSKRRRTAWVAQQTADVVRETQNGSSPLDLSINSAMSRDSGMAAFFLFTSDPLKARNRIARAYKQSVAEGAKQTAAEAASILIGISLARGAGWVISQGVAAALGGDDRDRKRITEFYFAPERILANAAREVAGDVAPVFGPALTDLLTQKGQQGSGLNPPALQAVNDMLGAIGSIKTAVMADRNKSDKLGVATEKFVSAVLTASGVNPFQAIWRTVWNEAKHHTRH